jgi:hypothetical protein
VAYLAEEVEQQKEMVWKSCGLPLEYQVATFAESDGIDDQHVHPTVMVRFHHAAPQLLLVLSLLSPLLETWLLRTNLLTKETASDAVVGHIQQAASPILTALEPQLDIPGCLKGPSLGWAFSRFAVSLLVVAPIENLLECSIQVGLLL